MARAARKPTVLEGLRSIDARLVAAGVHPISPWWWAELERFYAGQAPLLVEMVGRGGDKSRTSTKMAIAETLYGDFTIPKGEVHFFTHVSESVPEAEKTLGILRNYLTALGEPHEPEGKGTITLQRLPRGFKVLACRVGAVSGWRCFGWTADECAKWNNEGVDPSTEVITSIVAMTITHPHARGRMLSSPLGRLGYFYDEWQGGDTADRQVGQAPSWVANPGITEALTRRKEKNPAKWAREYAAIPMEGDEESLLSAAMLDANTRQRAGIPSRERGVYYVAAMDPGRTRNAWTFAVGCQRMVDGRVRRSIVYNKQWQGTPDKPLQTKWVLAQMAPVLRSYGLDAVYSDSHERFGIGEHGAEMEPPIHVLQPEWGHNEEYAAYEALERWAADCDLDLPPDPLVRADLLGIVRKLTPNGFVMRLLETPDGRHSDYSPTILKALAHAVVPPEPDAHIKPGSPEAWKAEEDRLEKAIDAELEREEQEERWG
jgi:hypothetical protein